MSVGVGAQVSAAVVALVSMGLAAGTVGAQVVSEPLGPVVVIAHRGASAYAPEHTFPAYDIAIDQDTDMLECDLQLTADDVLVCVHDTTVDRTSDGTGAIADMTLAELRELDWGSWFGPEFAGAAVVPFEEQLRCYRALNPGMRFHVETKAPEDYDGRMEPALVALLDRLGILDELDDDPQVDPIIVQSFSVESLLSVIELESRLATALLFLNPPLSHPGVAVGQLPDGVDAAAPSRAFLAANPSFVALAHANGHEVHTWTVDDPTEMQGLLALGVDGIFSNRPDVARAEVDASGRGTTTEQRGNPVEFEPGCAGMAGSVEAGEPPPPTTPSTTASAASPTPEPQSGSRAMPATGARVPLAVGVGLGLAAVMIRRRSGAG